MSPAALGALTLRSVRFLSPEAPGWRETHPTGAPYSLRALSLGGGWYISDPIIAICHNSAAAKGHSAPCVQLNYSMCKAFVNRFGQNLRDPDAVHMGYFTVLNRHGRISRIPSINIFFVPHGIANRPVSLCNHWVGFKICRAIR